MVAIQSAMHGIAWHPGAPTDSRWVNLHTVAASSTGARWLDPGSPDTQSYIIKWDALPWFPASTEVLHSAPPCLGQNQRV
ncbi:hypothetical protein VNO77_26929 [Canavalia gladiata]|uniref:Uncharacterized protein n=1 Tax=Canavalia gladiata TaxID=3824 RepID=A0AAN9KUW4_CANGL